MGAAGFETADIRKNTEKSGTSGVDDSTAVVGSNEAKCADTGGLNDSLNASPDVESVLARAIEAATPAGRFDVVAQLCRELEARRLARLGNVVSIDARRSKV